MSGIISEASLAKLEIVRKTILKIAIWMLVAVVIVGALSILIVGTSGFEILGKFIGTVAIVSVMLLISVNNFKRVASGIPAVQRFAFLGLVTNICWALLWILLCWNPSLGATSCSSWSCGYSWLMKMALIFSYVSALGLICSNVLMINEGGKRNVILPLKITAVVCVVYEMLYGVLTAVMNGPEIYRNDFLARLGMLAAFVGFAWVVVVIVALTLSNNEKKRQLIEANRAAMNANMINPNMGMGMNPNMNMVNPNMAVGVTPNMNMNQNANIMTKSDDELRAEIEEKVRREMIEKEVRAKLEAEKANKTNSGASDDSLSGGQPA